MKKFQSNISLYLALALIFILQAQVKPQDVKEGKKEETKKRGFLFFKKDELTEKQKKERAELREKQKKERIAEQERIEAEAKSEAKADAEEAELAQEKREIRLKNKYLARRQIKDRKKEIRKAKRSKKSIAVVTSEEDPLYISDVQIKKSKTLFLKLQDVDLHYKLKVQNQTPKIINSIIVVWERKIPFTDSLTIERELRISKPMIPYEKRTIEHHDLDSKREGETYRVRVARVYFEDGSQWKNPAKLKEHKYSYNLQLHHY